MGRNIIKIDKIENHTQRLYAYAQRKRGLLKKAMEISILCEQDLYLVFYDKKDKKLVQLSSSEDFNLEAINHLINPELRDQMKSVEIYENADLELLEHNCLTDK